MPRRRVTTAKQRAASARNLVNARKHKPHRAVAAKQAHIESLRAQGLGPDVAKPVPTGKNVLVVHRTTPAAADAIVKGGFKDVRGGLGRATTNDAHVYGISKRSHNSWAGYGSAAVSVTVPRRHVKPDTTMSTYYPQPVKVPLSALAGVKVKRVK